MGSALKAIGRAASQYEPAWDVAYLFPPQGQWCEEEYLALPGNRLVEFSEGTIEVLPMPTTSHQMLVTYIFGLLLAYSELRDAGTPLLAPLRIRLWRGKFREPDVVFMRKEHAQRMGEEFWDRADLVMEVLSDDPKDRRRDLETKRREYAKAAIPEYWIVDPQQERILVLRLSGKNYAVHGEYSKGMVAASCLLPEFTAEVSAVLARRMRAGSTRASARPPNRPRRN